MKVKIHCFEGEWNKSHSELSVRPLLQVLEQSCLSLGITLSCSYRFCQTVKRLSDNITSLDGRTFTNRSRHCFYFAFHGSSKGLWSLDDEPALTFEQLASELNGNASESIVFFGSCGTTASVKKLDAFKRDSGAALVIGYTSSVDWLPASIFELFFLSEFCRMKDNSMLNSFRKKIEQSIATGPFAKLKVQIV